MVVNKSRTSGTPLATRRAPNKKVPIKPHSQSGKRMTEYIANRTTEQSRTEKINNNYLGCNFLNHLGCMIQFLRSIPSFFVCLRSNFSNMATFKGH